MSLGGKTLVHEPDIFLLIETTAIISQFALGLKIIKMMKMIRMTT